MNYDLAVLRVENSDILKASSARAVTFADSEKVCVGETAIAIGNAEGLGISVSSGVVSVDSENVSTLAADGKTEVDRRLMRTDAPVNHGNSGGGLFNDKGELLGIVSAKLVDVEIEGMGYAIPSVIVKNITENIIDNCWQKDCETVQRVILGITLVASNSRAVYDFENGRVGIVDDAVVSEVSYTSAFRYTLKVNDVVLSVTVGDETLQPTRMHQIIDFLLKARVGDTVTFKVMRGSSEQSVSITVTQGLIKSY